MSSAAYPSALSAGTHVSVSNRGGPHSNATVLLFSAYPAVKQVSEIICWVTRPRSPDHVSSCLEMV